MGFEYLGMVGDMGKVQLTDGRHKRSFHTRQKLLAAARQVFLQHGFQKTTITQIIKQANTGYGTAYVHFTGKDDILIALMEDVMNRFYEIAELPFTPRSKAEAQQLIEKQVGMFLSMAEPERPLMQVFEEAIGISPTVRQKWKEIREKFIKRISQDVAYAQQAGLARMDVDHLLVARGWFFSGEMYLWEIVRNEHKVPVPEIARTLTAIYTSGLYK